MWTSFFMQISSVLALPFTAVDYSVSSVFCALGGEHHMSRRIGSTGTGIPGRRIYYSP